MYSKLSIIRKTCGPVGFEVASFKNPRTSDAISEANICLSLTSLESPPEIASPRIPEIIRKLESLETV